MADVKRCSGCGGILVWDAHNKCLSCENCGNTVGVALNKGVTPHSKSEFEGLSKSGCSEGIVAAFTCEGCGCTIEVHNDRGAGSCPYCGTDFIMSESVSVRKPDGIVPFGVDPKELPVHIKKWMKWALLAPNDFKSLAQQGAVEGTYVPFWSFAMNAGGEYKARGGERHEVEKDDGSTERTVTWVNTGGRVSLRFNEIAVPATASLDHSLMKRVAGDCTMVDTCYGYTDDCVSGFRLELQTVGVSEALEDAYRQARERVKNKARSDVLRRYDEVDDLRLTSFWAGNESALQVAMPVYLTEVHYRGRDYQVLINGMTGDVHGHYPKSPVKIAILILVCIVIMVLGWMYENSNSNACNTSEIVYDIDMED